MVDKLRQTVMAQAMKARASFLSAIHAARALQTQETLIAECVGANCETAFGREHGFGKVRNIDDYRHAVPIRHYDELVEWISRSADGEERVLTAEEPIRFFKTTGTTSVAKKIPVTPASAMRNMESFLALHGTQLHYHPELNERADTTLVTYLSPKKVKEFLGPRKLPYCSTTEVPNEIRRGREDLVPPWTRKLQDVVEDDSVRLYFLLCFAASHDLYNITCLHPSRFQTVASTLQQKWPQIVKELRDGTVLGERIRDPAPERAQALEAIASKCGTLRPRDVWPNLKFVASWSGSYIDRYRPTMEGSFAEGFMPMPSISSEAFATMTIDENPISQPLNVRGGVFEFVPADQKVEPASPTLQFHELAEGESYEVVLTTLSGLYRYAMCDIFKVHGFVGRVPRLEYTGRRSVSDLTGEKLAEEQVEDVVAAVLQGRGLKSASFAMCAIRSDDPADRPKYVLALELSEAALASSADELAAELDTRFRKVNSRYELKRNFGDLKPIEVLQLEAGTFGRYRERLIRRGMPAGQLKDKVLHKDGIKALADLIELGGGKPV
jgi:hypothetical protein